jgi:asparagine synthase (glutamine-hydrolysing)
MSFCISFSKNRSTLHEQDLRILGPDESPSVQHAEPIIVTMSDHEFVGRCDSKSERITAVVSGSLINLPSPFRPGRGSVAAEALAALYARFATQAFDQIDGPFSAAIIDWRRNKILLVRDKLGIGRAYVSRTGDTVTFSDSLSDLLAAARRGFDVDLDSIYAFLMIGWIPTPHSMFREIEKLPPGTFLESNGETLTQTTYYDVPHSRSIVHHLSPAVLREKVTEHLDRSVARGLALGGRWGSFLSGGVDSSSVVSSIAQSRNSFPTYFGGFDPQLNRYLPNPEEPAMSQLVAARYKTDHHMLWLGPEVADTTPEIINALEEPVSDGGCLIVGAVMRAARRDVDGLMTGIGGDFIFTGERRHMVLNLLGLMRRVPNPFWQALNWLSGVQPLARDARISQLHFDLTRLLAIRDLDIEAMYAGFFLQAQEPELKLLFLPEALASLSRDPLQEMRIYFQRTADLEPLARFLYLDLKNQATDHSVREAETLGRHFKLSIFNPFLDSEFVDFAMTIPVADKVSRLRLKIPLKAAMRKRLPAKVLNHKKGGLASPIRWWVTQSDGFVSTILSRHNIERRGIFSADTVEQFRQATASGARDYSKLLWSLFTLELWLQRFVDRTSLR